MMSQNHLLTLCRKFELGHPKGDPTSIYGSRGGSLMWRVETDKGVYAIKQLASEIDLKSERMLKKYEITEEIAYQFAQQGLPAISSIKASGKHLIILDDIGYLVYPWIEGRSLPFHETSEIHVHKIAQIIAKIHQIDLILPDIDEPRYDIHSNDNIVAAIDRSIKCDCPFANGLKEMQHFILCANDLYQASIPTLKEEMIITHGDMDQMNILWDKNNQPFIIDWETSRKLNKTRDTIRTGLAWSGLDTENFSLSLYKYFLKTYVEAGGKINTDHVEAALYSVYGSMINWLLYNINLSCTNNARTVTAMEEVKKALHTITRLQSLIPGLIKIAHRNEGAK